MELEKDVERTLGGAIKRAGGLCLKWTCPGWAGVPDRICLLPGGKIVFVELKRPSGGVISLRQEAWARRLRRLGFRVEFIRTKDQVTALAAEFYRPIICADTCVCCGAVIPEGRQVCPQCEKKTGEKNDV